VQKVILRLRCERIIEMFKSLKKDREIFDQECFKFNQDEENCLYRKFLTKWNDTWSIWGSRSRALSFYYGTPLPDSNQESGSDDMHCSTKGSICPSITLTETQESNVTDDLTRMIFWAEQHIP